MLFADYNANLHLYQYIPLRKSRKKTFHEKNNSVKKKLLTFFFPDKESRGGSRLLPIGNFHLGTRVHKLLRLNLNILKTTQAPQRANYKRNCIMYGGIN